ncbi:MAG: uracil-DNA glycosylase [Thermoplasmata archaeon]|nr:uracil-DNA glycosylase [Thermoplasmata archaeon]
MTTPTDSLAQVRDQIVGCRLCSRLVAYRERVAADRKPEFRNDLYWGKGVPGFGDPNARLVIVGLAPAAHGSNRTGRVFTGDRSAAFLVRSLNRAGYANQPTSTRRSDGLRYTDAYVTAAVRCVPPNNRPHPDERTRCLPYLVREFHLLTSARAYLALGAFAWDATLDAVSETFGIARPKTAFAHGACAPLGEGRPLVWGSYHPSPQNTNTGKLTQAMFDDLLDRIASAWTPTSPLR